MLYFYLLRCTVISASESNAKLSETCVSEFVNISKSVLFEALYNAKHHTMAFLLAIVNSIFERLL